MMPSPGAPRFSLDRGLGAQVVPAALRTAEAMAVVMTDARFLALANARESGPENLRCFPADEVAVVRWATRVKSRFVAVVGPDWVRR